MRIEHFIKKNSLSVPELRNYFSGQVCEGSLRIVLAGKHELKMNVVELAEFFWGDEATVDCVIIRNGKNHRYRILKEGIRKFRTYSKLDVSSKYLDKMSRSRRAEVADFAKELAEMRLVTDDDT